MLAKIISIKCHKTQQKGKYCPYLMTVDGKVIYLT